MSKTQWIWTIMYPILALLCLYIAAAAYLFFFQSRFVYFPESQMIASPHDEGLKYEAILFRSQDGVELSGWFVPAANPRGVLLFCHGNAGNISHRLQSIRIFNRLGLSIFIFDYRGFGQSQGKPGEKGTYLDAGAAWDFLVQTKGIPPPDIVLFGESLGGAVAAWLAQDHKPAALILQSAFTSVPDLAAKLYPIFPVRLLARFDYATADYLRRVDCPVLIIHSRDDEIVPYAHGMKLYDSAKGPKKFLEMRGDHNSGFLMSEESYTAGLDLFLSTYLKKQTPP